MDIPAEFPEGAIKTVAEFKALIGTPGKFYFVHDHEPTTPLVKTNSWPRTQVKITHPSDREFNFQTIDPDSYVHNWYSHLDDLYLPTGFHGWHIFTNYFHAFAFRCRVLEKHRT